MLNDDKSKLFKEEHPYNIRSKLKTWDVSKVSLNLISTNLSQLRKNCSKVDKVFFNTILTSFNPFLLNL